LAHNYLRHKSSTAHGSTIVKFKRSYLQTFSGKVYKILGLARCGKGSVTTGLKPCGGAATIDPLEQLIKIDLEAAFLVILSSNTAIKR
jgi:hypothetical protein